MTNWTDDQINEFKRFKAKAKSRLSIGESEESAFRGKPSGFSEWLKEEYEKNGGIKLINSKNVNMHDCWNCGKKYRIDYKKCPYCRSFNPEVNKNR